MKKLLVMLLIIMCFLMSCNNEKEENNNSIENITWNEISKAANGTTVDIYMWGGSIKINNFIDKDIKSKLKEKNNITLNRVPINDAKDIVNKLITEKTVNDVKGSVDVFWVNGENFKGLKDSNSLYGSFIEILPNLEFVDKNTYQTDFGEPVENLEAPFGQAQFSLIYNNIDGGELKAPFTGHESLKKWVRDNPGKFTYPSPPDFTGSAFVRNMAINIIGVENLKDLSDEEFKEKLATVWDYFNEIGPYLWREGKTYPEDVSKQDLLYGNEEILITMGYTPKKAESGVMDGVFPKNSRTFLLNDGTLSNNHYLTIPFNSNNIEGALYVINYLIGKEAQIMKANPKNWGDGAILDISKLSEEEKSTLEEHNSGEANVSVEELSQKSIKELKPAWTKIIEEEWEKNVSTN